MYMDWFLETHWSAEKVTIRRDSSRAWCMSRWDKGSIWTQNGEQESMEAEELRIRAISDAANLKKELESIWQDETGTVWARLCYYSRRPISFMGPTISCSIFSCTRQRWCVKMKHLRKAANGCWSLGQSMLCCYIYGVLWDLKVVKLVCNNH